MNAICGMTKVMKSSKLDKDQAECVQIISSSTKALLRLLNDILDFSKIAARKEEIRVSVVPVYLQGRSESTDLMQLPVQKETRFDLFNCIKKVMSLMVNGINKRK